MRSSPALVLFFVLLVPARAFGFGAGVFGFSGKPPAASCTNCHNGGPTPTVTLSGPTTLALGATGTYTLDIVTGASGRSAGFDVATSDGVIGKVPQANATWVNNGELSHTKAWPKGATVQVQLTLTAPLTGGPVTLYATGLSSNGADDTVDDGTASTTLQVNIEGGADLAGFDLSDGLDLSTIDAVSSATPMQPQMAQIDLGPPHDEARWACACELGRSNDDARGTRGALLAAVAFALLAFVRRRSQRSVAR